MKVDNYRAALEEINARSKELSALIQYKAGVDDPFFGVLAQPTINGNLIAHPPFGPFRSVEDAIDYFVHKRSKHDAKRLEFLTPDARLFVNPGFGFQVLTVAEFVSRTAAQIQMTALAILVGASAGDQSQHTLPPLLTAVEVPVEEIELLPKVEEDGA